MPSTGWRAVPHKYETPPGERCGAWVGASLPARNACPLPGLPLTLPSRPVHIAPTTMILLNLLSFLLRILLLDPSPAWNARYRPAKKIVHSLSVPACFSLTSYIPCAYHLIGGSKPGGSARHVLYEVAIIHTPSRLHYVTLCQIPEDTPPVYDQPTSEPTSVAGYTARAATARARFPGASPPPILAYTSLNPYPLALPQFHLRRPASFP